MKSKNKIFIFISSFLLILCISISSSKVYAQEYLTSVDGVLFDTEIEDMGDKPLGPTDGPSYNPVSDDDGDYHYQPSGGGEVFEESSDYLVDLDKVSDFYQEKDISLSDYYIPDMGYTDYYSDFLNIDWSSVPTKTTDDFYESVTTEKTYPYVKVTWPDNNHTFKPSLDTCFICTGTEDYLYFYFYFDGSENMPSQNIIGKYVFFKSAGFNVMSLRYDLEEKAWDNDYISLHPEHFQYTGYGYKTTKEEDDETVLDDWVCYDRLARNETIIATNCNIFSYRNIDMQNDFGVSNNTYFNNSDMDSSLYNFYKKIRSFDTSDNKVIEIHPLKDINGASGGGDDFSNHTYLPEGSFIESSFKSANDGDLLFYVVPDSKQSELLNNYEIRVYPTAHYTVSVSDKANLGASDLQQVISYYGFDVESYTAKQMECKYYGTEYFVVDLSDCANKLYKYHFSDINSDLKYEFSRIDKLASYLSSKGEWSNFMRIGSSVSASLNGANLIKATLNLGSLVERTGITVDRLDYDFTIKIYNKNNEYESTGSKIHHIDMITGEGRDLTDNLTKTKKEVDETTSSPDGKHDPDFNTNPPDNTTTVTSQSDGASATATATANNNATNTASIDKDAVNINIENNSGGSSAPTETTDSSLLHGGGVFQIISSLIGDNKSEPDEYIENTGVGGWFQVLSSVYTFVPVELWTIILSAVACFFGITIIAFIIRVILDLL